MKEKLTNLNILRFISALSIFFYHGYCNMNCDFGEMNNIFTQSSFFMTLFFAMSGFVLFYNYHDRNLEKIDEIKKFYCNRMKSIFPIYFLIWIVFLLIDFHTDVIDDIITFPYQLSLLQNVEHYFYLSNSGTWFFSCLFICYLVYPYISLIVRQINKRETLYLLVGLILLACFSPFLMDKFGTNPYYNAFVRIWEFFIGILVAKLYIENKNKQVNDKALSTLTGLIFVFSLAGLFTLKKYVPQVNECQEMLKGFSVVFGSLLLYFFAKCKSKFWNWLGNSKIVAWGSDYSLEFWCATFFTSPICNLILYNELTKLNINTNGVRITVTFVTNIIIALLLRKYGVLSKKLISKITLKKYFLIFVVFFFVIYGIKAYVQYGPLTTYDFENKKVNVTGIKGTYADEGTYTWINNDFEVRLLNVNASKIKFKAATTKKEGVVQKIYVNNMYVGECEISADVRWHEIELPEEIANSPVLEVELKSENEYVPAEIFENSTDTRRLTMQLYFLGCK